jgi:hypothetical protein
MCWSMVRRAAWSSAGEHRKGWLAYGDRQCFDREGSPDWSWAGGVDWNTCSAGPVCQTLPTEVQVALFVVAVIALPLVPQPGQGLDHA